MELELQQTLDDLAAIRVHAKVVSINDKIVSENYLF
jgi:hypothetical protein